MAALDLTRHRTATIDAPPARHLAIGEVPTLVVAVLVHGGWLSVTWWHAQLPAWLLVAAGGWLLAWHGSLQHETIHGHPTPRRWLNTLIGGVPLSLWLPYAIYRRTHLDHHRTPVMTDPLHDPESRYLPAGAGRVDRLLGVLEASLLGRVLLGPVLTLARFLAGEARRLVDQPRVVAREWLPHLVGVAAVLSWLAVCGLPVGRYVLCFVYPGMMLTLLRSFAEHRAAAEPDHRVAIVESSGPLALLFLNNNLHAAHHAAPGLAWFRLPGFYAAHRQALLAANGGLVYRGYRDVLRRFALRPHHVLIHPGTGG